MGRRGSWEAAPPPAEERRGVARTVFGFPIFSYHAYKMYLPGTYLRTIHSNVFFMLSTYSYVTNERSRTDVRMVSTILRPTTSLGHTYHNMTAITINTS